LAEPSRSSTVSARDHGRLGPEPSWQPKDQRITMAAAGPKRLEELSPQELQVARIAARGQNNIEVAAALFVSRKTVEAHLTRVYRKLGIRSRTELARILLVNGIADRAQAIIRARTAGLG
jgi:DNA-binding NarL/FixJ family response regulator